MNLRFAVVKSSGSDVLAGKPFISSSLGAPHEAFVCHLALFTFGQVSIKSTTIDPTYGVDINPGFVMAAATLSPGPSGSGTPYKLSSDTRL